MPNIKAAEKWGRQTAKRTVQNKDRNSRLKTLFKKAVSQGDGQFAQSVESAFDKAAKTGVIHKNKAARKKSRLAKAMAKVATSAPAKAKSTRSTAKSAAAKTTRKTSAKK